MHKATALLAVPANSAHELDEGTVVRKLVGNQEVKSMASCSLEVDTSSMPLVDEGDRIGLKVPVCLGVEGNYLEGRRDGVREIFGGFVSPLDVDQASVLGPFRIEEVFQLGDLEVLRHFQHDRYLAVVNVDT